MIEHQGAPLGARHAPLHPLVGAGEGSGAVAEELALEEGGGHHRRIDLDERTGGAPAGGVEGAGEGRAAAAGLAQHEDRGVARRRALDAAQRGQEAGEVAG